MNVSILLYFKHTQLFYHNTCYECNIIEILLRYLNATLLAYIPKGSCGTSFSKKKKKNTHIYIYPNRVDEDNHPRKIVCAVGLSVN